MFARQTSGLPIRRLTVRFMSTVPTRRAHLPSRIAMWMPEDRKIAELEIETLLLFASTLPAATGASGVMAHAQSRTPTCTDRRSISPERHTSPQFGWATAQRFGTTHCTAALPTFLRMPDA